MKQDMNKNNNVNDMRLISFEEFKTIYKGYYKTIVDLLIKHNVPFSSACGTMLGAVREHDMIEWDFDIDNFFFIEDIDKLLSIEKDLPDNFYFETYLDGTLRYGLVRIFCKNLFRHDKKSTRYVNVFIDFFAIRNVDIAEDKRAKLYSNVLKEEKKVAFKNSIYKSKNIFKAALKKMYQFFLPSAKTSSKHIERKMKKLKDGQTCVMCRNGRLVSSLPINKEEVVYMQFDSYKIPCYKNYELVLQCLFGDTWKTPIVYNDRVIPEFYIK